MAAIRNAWDKVRGVLVRAVQAPRAGVTKLGGTAPIQKTRSGLARVGGTAPIQKTRAGVGQVGKGFGWATSGVRAKAAQAGQSVRGGVAKATEAPRARITSWRDEAREHPTLAVGIAAGVLVGIAWIAWAIYVTASNGANAGLGVLLTWPVLIGALALMAAPFVLTAILIQRHREATPAVAGGGAVTGSEEATAEEDKPKDEAEGSEGTGEEDEDAEDDDAEEEEAEAEAEADAEKAAS